MLDALKGRQLSDVSAATSSVIILDFRVRRAPRQSAARADLYFHKANPRKQTPACPVLRARKGSCPKTLRVMTDTSAE